MLSLSGPPSVIAYELTNTLNESITAVTKFKRIIGLNKGTVTFLNMVNFEAPSRYATSYKEVGIP